LALPAPLPQAPPQWPPEPRIETPTPDRPMPPPWMRPQSHIIVFANEKGGVGKSTTAFHTCIALCNAGEKVAAIDVDLRQLTL
ncbi:division plane positioning ATPase MipZ, partial [Listeria monocytogenes]|uniref:division plane positioning ATPase MipZ n=1 Tax=Listeria monocytogenes TaxID=1639 RepID=UPI002FDC4293